MVNVEDNCIVSIDLGISTFNQKNILIIPDGCSSTILARDYKDPKIVLVEIEDER